MMDAIRVFERIRAQVDLGPRFAGSPGHGDCQALLDEWLAEADEILDHSFCESFFGTPVTCRNLWRRFRGGMPGRLLLGTHYDTRPFADRDTDPVRCRQPVPGANDGASGTAILAELAQHLEHTVPYPTRPTIDIVLFDAEDWHGIDGKQVALGARRFVADLQPREQPDAVVILDMVAGRKLCLNEESSCRSHGPSHRLTGRLFAAGEDTRLSAFGCAARRSRYHIRCDHTPFQAAGIPTAVLIDIDYPPWHTTHDLPEACDVASVAQVAQFVELIVGTPALWLQRELVQAIAS